MKTNCIVFPRARQAEVGTVEIRSPGEGELLTRTRITGVSTGTETRVYRGKQHGATFPLIPGYENIGEVIEAGAGTTIAPGQRLFVRTHLYDPAPYTRTWGGQIAHSLTNEDALVLIPDEVSDERAIYAKVAAIALHGVKRAAVREGEWVVVVGLGIIGHLVAQHCIARGARVVAVDMDESRRALASQAGTVAEIDASASDALERVHEVTGGGASVVFDATGVASVLPVAARYLRSRAWDDDLSGCGRLVLQGSLETPITLDYNETFMQEIDLILPRDCDTQDLIDSLDLMASGALRPELIPATTYPFADCTTAYDRLVNREIMRVLYTWEAR